MSFKNIFQIIPNNKIEDQIYFLGGILLNNSGIYLHDTEYKIIDAEVLCYVKNLHEDPWLHSHYSQLLNNTWYFHGKNTKRYGLDITFGDKDQNIYASVFLRRVVRTSDSLELNGPSEVSNFFLNSLGYKTKEEFYDADIKGASKDANPSFYIKTIKNFDPQRIYNVPRMRKINHSFFKKNTSKKLEFLFKPYRFTTNFDKNDPNKAIIRAWANATKKHQGIYNYLPLTDNVMKKHQLQLKDGKLKDISEIKASKSKLSQKLQLLGKYLK